MYGFINGKGRATDRNGPCENSGNQQEVQPNNSLTIFTSGLNLHQPVIFDAGMQWVRGIKRIRYDEEYCAFSSGFSALSQ